MIYLVILAALLLVIILLFLIYKKDRLQPEPIPELIKGVLCGIASVILSYTMSIPLSIPFGNGFGLGLFDSAYQAFLLAAVPEEIAKFVCLYWFLRKNKYYDEYMDGIVYAVCIGLGFAGLENLMYLFGSGHEWVSTGIMRAIISVPGHYAFAILMGYYYSHWRILNDSKSKYLMLFAPIIAHGIFDFMLFWSGYLGILWLIIAFVFIFFLVKMHRHCSKLIAQQLKIDEYRMGIINQNVN